MNRYTGEVLTHTGETLGALHKLETRSNLNMHDYAIAEVTGVPVLGLDAVREGAPIKLRWGVTNTYLSSRPSGGVRELVGYVVAGGVERAVNPERFSVHIAGTTGRIQGREVRAVEEVWTNRTPVSVIEEVVGRYNISMLPTQVTGPARERMVKPEFKSYWEFAVELADSVGADLVPLNGAVALLDRLTVVDPDNVVRLPGRQALGDPDSFNVKATAALGERVLRNHVVVFEDYMSGDEITLDSTHLPRDTMAEEIGVEVAEGTPDVHNIGVASYSEALERLTALYKGGAHYVEADLHLRDAPVIHAFPGLWLDVQTAVPTAPDNGLWRVEEVVSVVEFNEPGSFSQQFELTRSGLGAQTIRKAEDSAPYLRRLQSFAGRYHIAEGWVAA